MRSYNLLILICLFTGCATYQYATISSSLNNQNSETFIAENDTAKITYEFSGENGPVKISIYNKLPVPLYIDWSKSALIISDERIPYYNNKSTINADLTSTGLRSSTYRTGSIEGVITNNDVFSFIPPQSLAKESQLVLKSNLFNLSKFPSTREKNKVSGMKVTSFYFTQENSPLNFRSFLTLSTNQNFNTPIYFDHNFWVSKISETLAEPRYFIPQGDGFYISGYIGE